MSFLSFAIAIGYRVKGAKARRSWGFGGLRGKQKYSVKVLVKEKVL
jgi:hypothetical protein